MLETVRLSDPVDYLAIAPYLLGFHPTLSLVMLVFRGQALVTGVRHDLPRRPDEARDTITACGHVLACNEADAVAVIGYGPADQVAPLLDGLQEAIASAGVVLAQMLRCEGDRYWSHLDTDPFDGIPFDIRSSQAAAGAVLAGLSACPDRDAFAACLGATEGRDRAAVQQATHAARERAATLLTSAPPRYWYDEGLRQIHDAFARSAEDKPITPEQLAWLSVLLTSILVRDAAMTLLGTYTEAAHIKLWGEVTRRAEPGYVAAPATLLAFAAYSTGAGTLARIALDRAQADDPRYRLAVLLDYGLSNCESPSVIHAMRVTEMAEVIEEQVVKCPLAALPRLPESVEGR
ncbi:DUF4192 domain-containing protein [Nonomuraea sp. NPDC002799]